MLFTLGNIAVSFYLAMLLFRRCFGVIRISVNGICAVVHLSARFRLIL